MLVESVRTHAEGFNPHQVGLCNRLVNGPGWFMYSCGRLITRLVYACNRLVYVLMWKALIFTRLAFVSVVREGSR